MVLNRCSVFERPLPGALDDVDGRQDDLTRSGEIGIAAGYVGDERWFIFEMKGHEEENQLESSIIACISCTTFSATSM
jgi:hypothetical protein